MYNGYFPMLYTKIELTETAIVVVTLGADLQKYLQIITQFHT